MIYSLIHTIHSLLQPVHLAPYFHLVPMPTFSPLGCGSPLYSIAMTFRKSLILLLILCWPISLRTPLCQVVIALWWVFPALLSFNMSASLTLHFSHIAWACLMSSHVEPFYISFASWFPFSPGGDFPPSVDILHMYPCIEHRYVPLLGSSLFSLITLVSS